MTYLLEVEGLASGYGTSEVISDVSFTLAKSDVLAVVGKNGMGKTSLLKAVLGFLPAWRGRVKFAGVDVTRVPPPQKRRPVVPGPDATLAATRRNAVGRRAKNAHCGTSADGEAPGAVAGRGHRGLTALSGRSCLAGAYALPRRYWHINDRHRTASFFRTWARRPLSGLQAGRNR